MSVTTATASTGQATEDVGNVPAPHYTPKDEKFYFRKPTKPNELGEIPEKRAPITLTLPVPTWDGLVASLRTDEGDKKKTYILSLLEDAIIEAARAQVGDTDKPVNKQDELDVSKLTLDFLANEPRVDRRGRGIDKETWDAFEADYITIISGLTELSEKQAAVASNLFAKKLSSVKTNKPVLHALAKRLEQWAGNTPNLGDFEDLYKYLAGKLETYITAPDQDLLGNL